MEKAGTPLFENLLEYLMGKSIFGEVCQKNKENNEYDNLVKELIPLGYRITACLGKDKNLFHQYEEISSARAYELMHDSYKQGFFDAIQLFFELLYIYDRGDKLSARLKGFPLGNP